jgi:hypothetical protein
VKTQTPTPGTTTVKSATIVDGTLACWGCGYPTDEFGFCDCCGQVTRPEPDPSPVDDETSRSSTIAATPDHSDALVRSLIAGCEVRGSS